MPINMDGLGDVDSANVAGDAPIPDGEYLAVVKTGLEDVSEAGNPVVKLTFELLDGEHKGRERWDNWAITAKSLGFVKGKLEALGRVIPKGAFDLDASSLAGARAVIVLRSAEETYKGETKMRQRIVGYKPASSAVASGLASRMGAQATIVEDDDIPF